MRGKTNKLVLDRINVHMGIENFDGRMDFIINTFNLFILLMKSNEQGRNFMRVPLMSESGSHSFNLSLIIFSVKILSSLLKNMNERCLKIADTIMEFILECIIGPSPDNQDEVLKTNFAGCVKELLNEYGEGIELISTRQVRSSSQFNKLCTKSLIVTKYLLEGNRKYDMNRLMISCLLKPQYLIMKIKDDLKVYYEKRIDKTNKRKLKRNEKAVKPVEKDKWDMESLETVFNELDLIDQDLTSIFEQFFVLKMISKHDIKHNYIFPYQDETERVTLEFLEKHSGNIEVVFENKIHTVYLEIQPLFRYLGSEEMNLVTSSVRRDTPKNKILDFINLMPMIFDMISYKTNLKKRKFYFSEKIYTYLQLINFMLIVIINVLTMILFTKKLDRGSSITDPAFDENHMVMKVLETTHLVILCIRVLIYLLFETRLELMKQWRSIFEKIIGKIKKTSTHNSLLPLSKKRFVDLKMKEQVALFAAYNELEGNSKNLEYIDFVFQSVYMVTGLPKFKSLLLYLAITLYAFIYDIHFFYSILLLDVIVDRYNSTRT